jgi:hypothetical protein
VTQSRTEFTEESFPHACVTVVTQGPSSCRPISSYRGHHLTMASSTLPIHEEYDIVVAGGTVSSQTHHLVLAIDCNSPQAEHVAVSSLVVWQPQTRPLGFLFSKLGPQPVTSSATFSLLAFPTTSTPPQRLFAFMSVPRQRPSEAVQSLCLLAGVWVGAPV